MAGINFDITANSLDFIKQIRDIQERVSGTRKYMEELGESIDNTFGGKYDTLEKLGTKIGENAERINKTRKELAELEKVAREAYDAGDSDGFAKATESILEQKRALDELIDETNRLNEIWNERAPIQNQSYQVETAPTTSAPMYFETQEQYEQAEQLRAKIVELREQIATFSGSEDELSGLKDELREQNTLLDKIEGNAIAAAEAYGDRLGTSAAEASTNLYKLNAAIDEQERVIQMLSESLDKAKASLDELDGSDDAEAIKNATQEYNDLVYVLQEASDKLAVLKGQQMDASSAWTQVEGEMNRVDSTLVKLLGGQDNYNKIVGNLPPIAQQAITSLTGMTGAAKAFIATPLGAIIAAIAVALQTLSSWFHSSEEGERAFATVTGVVSGVLNQLKEIVLAVGKALYNAFTDPQQAVKNFYKSIQQNIVNRIAGLGGIFKSLGKTISDVFSGNFKDVGNDVKEIINQTTKFATGVDNAFGKMANYMKDVKSKSEANMRLNQAQFDLDRKRSKWKNEEAKLENEILKTRNKIYSSQGKDRAEAIAKAESLIAQKYEKQKEFAREQLAIQKTRNSLTTNSKADYEAEERLQAELTSLEGREEQEKLMLTRQQAMLDRKNAAADAKEQNAAQKVAQKRIELAQKLLEIQQQNQDSEVQLMQEGSDKVLAQIDADYKKRISAVKKNAEQLAKANEEAGINGTEKMVFEDGTVSNLTTEQKAALSETVTLATLAAQKMKKQEQKAERDAINDYLIEYGNYYEKRKALAEKYESEINDAETEGQKKTLQKQLEQALRELDFSQMQKEINWEDVFGNLSYVATDTLDTLKKKIQSALTELQSKPIEEQDASSIKTLVDALNQINSEKISRNPFSSTMASLDKYKTSLTEARKAQNELSSAKDGETSVLEQYSKTEDEIVKSKMREMEVTYETTDEQGNLVEKTAKFGELLDNADKKSKTLKENFKSLGESINGVGAKLSQISEVGQVAQSALSSIGVELPKGISDALDGLGQAGDALESFDITRPGSLLNIKNYLNFLVGIGKTISGLFTGVGDLLFGGKNKEYDELYDKYSKVLDVWDELIEKKKEYISESWGTEVTAASNEALALLKTEEDVQRALAQSRLSYGSSWRSHSVGYKMWNGDDSYGFNGQTWKNQAANISKLVGTTIKGMDSLTSLNAEQLQKIKETYSGLWGSLDEEFRNALQQIIDYGDEYSDIIDTAKEQLTQVSFDSMYDSFVETLMDMDATSQDFADDFSEYMMKAFLAQEIGTKYQERLQAWYDSWAENMEDGELSDAELETMRSQYENIVNEALAERDRIAAITGYDSTSSSQEASSKGFTAMSEDTGSELNGRFTALQVAGESIAQNMILSMQGVNSLVDIARSGNELLNSILVQSALSNGFLEDISKFTKPLLQFSEKMDKLIDNTKSL